MATKIGNSVKRQNDHQLLVRGCERAALIPDLLVEARRVTNTVFAGWHGRRKRGIGENFWQFRPYSQGENVAAIDWRRSARENHLYVKDREWQATHTVWLWADESASMLYQSAFSQTSKQARALVIGFAMAELMARSGERVGWLGVHPPILSRHAGEKLAVNMAQSAPQTSLPGTGQVRDFCEIILISDFLDPGLEPEKMLADLTSKRIRGHLVQIIDPAEQSFPYNGLIEFVDPESGERLNYGAAEALREDYQARFERHTHDLSQLAHRHGLTHTKHFTDRQTSGVLQSLYENLSSEAAGFGTNSGRA